MPEGGFDLAIIGGGVNGCGIARDAAGRGLKVLLCEQDDLANATSSASTKLIHGGLRYLEYYAFRLVRESLVEREVLLRAAPHIIWPLRLVLPHHAALRPAWLIRLGLFVYDHLGGGTLLPRCRSLDLTLDEAGRPLKDQFRRGFEYSDCWVEDARLVVLNAVDAAARGAEIRVRTRVTAAARDGDRWCLTLEDRTRGGTDQAWARVLVNAAGPWAGEVIEARLHLATRPKLRLVKGSHIIVPRLFDHDRAYIFQNADGRIVFAIPYEHEFTLIGTTDQPHDAPPGQVAISEAEITYLCAAVSDYLATPVTPDQVRATYAGIRPLYDDGSSDAKAITRDYVLALDAPDGAPPLLSVFGGKLTTYRTLAEAVLKRLTPWFAGRGRPWTAGASLPGGDFPVDGVDGLARALRRDFPAVSPAHARRLVRAYGTRAPAVLGTGDLGRRFGADLTEAEVQYLITNEWARTAEDVLWRRSKLGLRLSAEDAATLDAWMASARA